MTTCRVCRGTGADPLSDNLNWLPCSHCKGSGQEPERQAPAPSFADLWTRYFADVTPEEWAREGWNMAGILGNLAAYGGTTDELTGPEMMTAANVIAAGLEERGYPLTHDVDTLTLTTNHAASSYGRPVLVLDGQAYGPADMTPAGVPAGELVTTWAAHFVATLPREVQAIYMRPEGAGGA